MTHLSGESPGQIHTDSLCFSLRVRKTCLLQCLFSLLVFRISEVLICEIHCLKKFNCSTAVLFFSPSAQWEWGQCEQILWVCALPWTRYLDSWITSNAMNSHLQSDLKRPSTLWCVVHTRSLARAQHWAEKKNGSKNSVQFFRTQSPRKCQTPPAGSRKQPCVCVCQPVFLCVCASVCVGVFERTRRDLDMHWEQAYMYVKENSAFLYNLGLIFIFLATTPIRYGNILLTNFMNMLDTGQTVFLVQQRKWTEVLRKCRFSMQWGILCV